VGLLQPHGRHRRGDGQARLKPHRLRISIISQDGSALPSDDHPFNLALDAIYDDVEENLRRHRLASNEGLPWRMESPDWAYSSGLDLPDDPVRNAEILAIVMRRLREARRALPDAQYEVTLDDKALAWD
jgi:hypothetical protein